MATSENAKIEIESGAGTLTTYAALTDSGDHQVFYKSGATIWSGKSGYKPDVRPNGMVSGRNVLSTHANDDTVTVAAFTAYSKGALQTVSATTVTIGRPGTDSRACVYSVTMASDGSMTKVKGTVSADTTFSATRDAAGGPPLIPAESVEVGQVRITSSAAAAIASSEIHQVVGTHTERSDYPTWDEDNIGDGEMADSTYEENAHIKFLSALPLIHTGSVPKAVYVQYYTPAFIELGNAMDFVPAEESHSVSSQQVYRGTVSSVSKSLGQGSFTALLNDGVTDALLSERDEVITVRFYPDEDEDAYTLMQGTLGVSRSFPSDNQNRAECTVTCERKASDFAS